MLSTIKIFSKAKQTKGKGIDQVTSIAVKTLFKTTYEPKTEDLGKALAACREFAARILAGRKLAGVKGNKQVPSSLYYEITYGDIVLRSDVSEVRAQWKGLVAIPQSKLKAVYLKGENVIEKVVSILNDAQVTASTMIESIPMAQAAADKVAAEKKATTVQIANNDALMYVGAEGLEVVN